MRPRRTMLRRPEVVLGWLWSVTSILVVSGVTAETLKVASKEITHKIHTEFITSEFWKEGVEKSKDLLENILSKIAKHERMNTQKFNIKLVEAYSTEFSSDGLEVCQYNDKNPEVGTLCESISNFDSVLNSQREEISFTCRESEQLYGIGYNRLHDFCKDEKVMKNQRVAWDVCLAEHYHWVDKTKAICIMKSHGREYIACYCDLKNDYPAYRGFCITKLECMWDETGTWFKPNVRKEMSSQCLEQLGYFVEANYKDPTWFKQAQFLDKLRPRAPYSKHSPCYEKKFVANFDIGQMDVEFMDGEVIIMEPSLNYINKQLNQESQEAEISPQSNSVTHKIQSPPAGGRKASKNKSSSGKKGRRPPPRHHDYPPDPDDGYPLRYHTWQDMSLSAVQTLTWPLDWLVSTVNWSADLLFEYEINNQSEDFHDHADIGSKGVVVLARGVSNSVRESGASSPIYALPEEPPPPSGEHLLFSNMANGELFGEELLVKRLFERLVFLTINLMVICLGYLLFVIDLGVFTGERLAEQAPREYNVAILLFEMLQLALKSFEGVHFLCVWWYPRSDEVTTVELLILIFLTVPLLRKRVQTIHVMASALRFIIIVEILVTFIFISMLSSINSMYEAHMFYLVYFLFLAICFSSLLLFANTEFDGNRAAADVAKDEELVSSSLRKRGGGGDAKSVLGGAAKSWEPTTADSANISGSSSSASLSKFAKTANSNSVKDNGSNNRGKSRDKAAKSSLQSIEERKVAVDAEPAAKLNINCQFHFAALSHSHHVDACSVYVVLTCSAKCLLKYHQPCWKAFLEHHGLKNDREIGNRSCTTPSCWGFFCRLAWCSITTKTVNKQIEFKPTNKPAKGESSANSNKHGAKVGNSSKDRQHGAKCKTSSKSAGAGKRNSSPAVEPISDAKSVNVIGDITKTAVKPQDLKPGSVEGGSAKKLAKPVSLMSLSVSHPDQQEAKKTEVKLPVGLNLPGKSCQPSAAMLPDSPNRQPARPVRPTGGVDRMWLPDTTVPPPNLSQFLGMDFNSSKELLPIKTLREPRKGCSESASVTYLPGGACGIKRSQSVISSQSSSSRASPAPARPSPDRQGAIMRRQSETAIGWIAGARPLGPLAANPPSLAASEGGAACLELMQETSKDDFYSDDLLDTIHKQYMESNHRSDSNDCQGSKILQMIHRSSENSSPSDYNNTQTNSSSGGSFGSCELIPNRSSKSPTLEYVSGAQIKSSFNERSSPHLLENTDDFWEFNKADSSILECLEPEPQGPEKRKGASPALPADLEPHWSPPDQPKDRFGIGGILYLPEQTKKTSKKEFLPYDPAVYPNINPMAAVLAKVIPQYNPLYIDVAVRTIQQENKIGNLTIKMFKEKVEQCLEQVEETLEGLDLLAIANAPEDGAHEDVEVEECLICTEPLEDDVQCLDPCQHQFHSACISSWLAKSDSCPKCRAVVSKSRSDQP